ncbi:YafY family protein [Humibacillus sp. DSM 29435]|uniref:helix-turn-helix transcriptional regulator n=1 Tax=Humibacillus sp. DSM 29435 TaxID=1869167 RepID=UPI0009F32D35|nr:WYL domain-containing protein [Humibacillus sp. DSM 29435]
MTETATQRLGRLLDMVPWLLRHRGVAVSEAAREFAISEQQVVDDLQLLFVCGTPGYGHAELIDAQWESGHIYLDNAEDIAAPMRLSQDEAVTLIAGLQALGSSLLNPEITERTLTKLRTARAATSSTGAAGVGAAGDPAARIALDLDDGSQHPAMAAVKEALTSRRRIHLRYYVPTRDETTERDVDLMRVVNLDGQWYAEGWCHRAHDVRLFRLDRIEAATVLEIDGSPPAQAQPRDLGDAFIPGPSDLTVVIDVSAEAAWIADYYPNEGVERAVGGGSGDGEPGAEGSVRVTLKVADPALVRRLMLRLGGEARVVEPPELAQAVAAEARAALSAYPPAPTRSSTPAPPQPSEPHSTTGLESD